MFVVHIKSVDIFHCRTNNYFTFIWCLIACTVYCGWFSSAIIKCVFISKTLVLPLKSRYVMCQEVQENYFLLLNHHHHHHHL